MGGAQSSNSFSSNPAAIVILDEYGRYKKSVDGEGDALSLAEGRLRTYGKQGRIYIPSTPVDDLEANGSFCSIYKLGDQREYFVPCPHCGHMDFLRQERFSYEIGRDPKAWMICEECGTLAGKEDYAPLYGEGEWRATRPEDAQITRPDITSYRMPAFLAPLEWDSWIPIAIAWDSAKSGLTSMQTVQNLHFGCAYAEEEITVGEEMLARHMIEYEEGVVPVGASVVTIAFDVQNDYLVWEAKAWGPRLKSWSIAVGEIGGSPSDPGAISQISALMTKRWPHANGGTLQTKLGAIDSGYSTEEVYKIVAGFDQPIAMKYGVEVSGYGYLIATKGGKQLAPDRIVTSIAPVKVGQMRYGQMNLWTLGTPIPSSPCTGAWRATPGTSP